MLARRTAFLGLLAAPTIIKTSGLLMAIKMPKATIECGYHEWDYNTNTWDHYRMIFDHNLNIINPNDKKQWIEFSHTVYKNNVLIKSRNGFV